MRILERSVSPSLQAHLVALLSGSSLVVAFRVAWECRSATIEHRGSTSEILRLVESALTSCGTRVSPATEVEADLARRRSAEHTLTCCAVVGFALSIAPTPAKPAFIALRLGVSLAVAILQRQAQRHATAPRLAQAFDLLSFVISTARAERVLYELFKSLLQKAAEHLVQPRLHQGRGAAALAFS